MDYKRYFRFAAKYISNDNYRFEFNASRGRYSKMDDETYLRKLYKIRMGYPLNLDDPKTFCEKLQWLKLYYRKPDFTIMVDKYQVKKYVSNRIGSEHVVPLLGVWDDPEKIDFKCLPERFVLKCNHNSGKGMFICTNKNTLDTKLVKRKLKKGLKQDYYITNREWPYKDIKRKIIAEKYMEDKISGKIYDYKFYCFNGVPKFLYVGDANIINGEKHDLLTFLDLNWGKTPFFRNDKKEIQNEILKPETFDEMVNISKVLSEGIPFVRVDLFSIDNKVYFSEFTFSPGSGFAPFSPYEWECRIGDYITLPRCQNKSYNSTLNYL